MFGHQLIDDNSVADGDLNLLFGALLLTSLGVFVFGNILLAKANVIATTGSVFIYTFLFLSTMYFVTKKTSSLGWGLVVTYLLLSAVVYSNTVIIEYICVVMGVCSVLYLIINIRIPRTCWVDVILMALVATFVILGVKNSYSNFDMIERAYRGDVHQDTLFHAAIAAMIKNYNLASTGLHGLIETPYHIFSHILIAGLSKLSGISVLEVYGIAPSLMFAPILLFSIAAFIAGAATTRKPPLSSGWCLAALILAVAPQVLGPWAVYNAYFISESYLVSIGLFMIGLLNLCKKEIKISDAILLLFIALATIVSKSSVGVIFVSVWFARLIFFSRNTRRLETTFFLATLVGAAWVLFDVAQSYANQKPPAIRVFGFIETFSFLGNFVGNVTDGIARNDGVSMETILFAIVSVLSFFLFHFLLTWLVVGSHVYRNGFRAAFQSPLALYSLVATTIGAIAVGTYYFGGPTHYFSNVAFFIALPGAVIMIATFLDRFKFNNRTLMAWTVIFVIVLGLPSYYKNSQFYHGYADEWITMVKYQPPVSASTVVRRLISIRLTAPTDVVLRANEDVLKSNPIPYCMAKPFFFPAISERAWADVIKNTEPGNCAFFAYHYPTYGVQPDDNSVKVPVRLISGMKVVDITGWQK